MNTNFIKDTLDEQFSSYNDVKSKAIISAGIITVLIILFIVTHTIVILEILRQSGIIFGIIQIISFLISCIYIICHYTLVIVLISQYFVKDDVKENKNMPKIAGKAFDIAKYIFYNILSYFNKNIEEAKQSPFEDGTKLINAGAVLFFIFMVHTFFSLIYLISSLAEFSRKSFFVLSTRNKKLK